MTGFQELLFTVVALCVAAAGLGALTQVLLTMWRNRRAAHHGEVDDAYASELERQQHRDRRTARWGDED